MLLTRTQRRVVRCSSAASSNRLTVNYRAEIPSSASSCSGLVSRSSLSVTWRALRRAGVLTGPEGLVIAQPRGTSQGDSRPTLAARSPNRP
jgi:hypothetical protein